MCDDKRHLTLNTAGLLPICMTFSINIWSIFYSYLTGQISSTLCNALVLALQSHIMYLYTFYLIKRS